jgi:hypothetical protein
LLTWTPFKDTGETSPKTAQRPRGARTDGIATVRTKSDQLSRNAGPRLNLAEIEKLKNLTDHADYGGIELHG